MVIYLALPNTIGGLIRKDPHNQNYQYLEDKTTNQQVQITNNKSVVDNHLAGTANRHNADNIVNDSGVTGSTVKFALNILQTQITTNENDIEGKYTNQQAQITTNVNNFNNHVAGSANKHTTTHITNDSSVGGVTTKDALNQLKNTDTALDVRIDNIIAQSGTSDTEVVDARSSVKYGAYTVLDGRLEAIEGRSKYFWTETHTIALAGTTITLANTPAANDKLLIYDTTYNLVWHEGSNFTRLGNVLTFDAMPLQLTFIIYNLG